MRHFAPIGLLRGNVVAGLLWGLTVAGLFWGGAFTSLELPLLDWRYHLRGEIPPDPRVIMVTVDEETLARYGPWPLPRQYHAAIVQRLTAAGAKVIALDIIFNEPSPDPYADQALVAAVAQSKRVVLPVYSPQKITYRRQGLYRLVPPLSEPFPALRQAAAGLGNILVVPESDGVTRRALAGVDYQGHVLPSLALEAVRLYYDLSPEQVRPLANQSLRFDGHTIPLDERGGFLPRYPVAPGHFPAYSYVEVLENRFPPDVFRHRIVLVGVTARGTHDSLLTPVSRQGGIMSGVEYHAAVVDTLLSGESIRRTPRWFSALVLLLMGTLSVQLFKMNHLRHKNIYLFLGLAGVWIIGPWAFVRYGWWLEMAAPSAALVGGYLVAVASSLRRAERERAQVAALFRRYVSPAVVAEILRHPEVAEPGGKRVQASVIFADLRDFSTFARRATPEEVMALLNDYLGELAVVVLNSGGLLDKFLGDAVMAVFGAPLPNPRHAIWALATARKMQERAMSISRRRQAQGLPVLSLGIGVSSGEVVAGHLGNRQRLEYTVVGEPVNLAARLASLAGPGEVLVSPATYSLVQLSSTEAGIKDQFPLVVHPSSPFRLKGWPHPVIVYQLSYLSTVEKGG